MYPGWQECIQCFEDIGIDIIPARKFKSKINSVIGNIMNSKDYIQLTTPARFTRIKKGSRNLTVGNYLSLETETDKHQRQKRKRNYLVGSVKVIVLELVLIS